MSLNRIRRLEVAIKELKAETEKLRKQIDEIAANIVSTLKALVEDAEQKIAEQVNTEVAKAMKTEIPPVTKPKRKTKKGVSKK